MFFTSSSKNSKDRINSTHPIESPWNSASLLSKYTLFYMIPLFRKSFKKQITLDDIGPPPRVDLSRTLGLKLQKNYNQQLIGDREPSLLRALLKTFGTQILLFSLLDFLSKCVFFPLQTIALGWLIRDAGIYLNFAAPNAALSLTISNITEILPTDPPANDDEAYWRIIFDAVYLMIFTLMALVVSHPFYFQTYHIGMKCRIACCYLIYKKSLRLSQSAMSETTVGQMVNLLSNDVNRFDQVVQVMPYIIIGPLQAIIIIAILSLFYLGPYPTLASLTAILLYTLFQTLMGRGFSKYRAKTAKRTDERVRLMNEIILAIRIIKMYAWEKPFKSLVYEARKRETKTIGVALMLKTINQTLFSISSRIIVFLGLVTYVLLGNSFNPEIVFVSVGLASLVRISLTLFFPLAVAYCAETAVSCQRINKFLMLPEIETSPSTYKALNDVYGCKYAIAMNKVYASWAAKGQDSAGPEARWAIIRNLTLTIRPRDLVLVVGRVGSGKSSALMAMLGELPIASGRLEINGRISYASQEPWIFSGTVRDNILFGKPYEPERYHEVVRVCSLERDIEILVDGDSTIVGERGVSLSGGQKARVNLARALYQEADIYFLDDPLSAVDAPVARHIFNQSLRVFLRRKTVILATHQLQFLRHATKVLVVDRDLPAAFGTLQDVIESEAFALVNYGKQAFEDATTTEAGTDVEDEKDKSRNRLSSDGERLIRASSQASVNLSASVKVIPQLIPDGKKSDKGDAADRHKANEGNFRGKGGESLSEVSSNFGTYFYYLQNASGAIMFIWFIFAIVTCQGLYQYLDYFLTYWTDSVQRKEYQGEAFVPLTYVDTLTTNQVIAGYASLIGISFIAELSRTATFFIGALRASINIHRRFFESVVRAPMSFFDFSPIGILLNRLSRDIGFVDEILPATAVEIVAITGNVLGPLILTTILDYKNTAPAFVLLIIVFKLRSYCARTIKRLKQIEGVTRSPIFSHLSTTLSGLPTIRVFKVQDEFMRMFDSYQDTHTSTWFSYISSGRWLAVSLDWACLFFIVVVTSLLLTLSLTATNASLIGLMISLIVTLPQPFQRGACLLVEVESQMTSVQRLKEFSALKSEEELMAIEPAAQSSTDSHLFAGDQSRSVLALQPTANEQAGEIRFVNVSLCYFLDEAPVLKALTFTIRPGEKVGVVGRTGAGKSSIVAALFRLYDFEGHIELDGVDTKTLTLAELRRKMSIIPQDPILFAGTIRKNLDPFIEHSDNELWDALDAVKLREMFARTGQGLESTISEGGSNFSVGQRQLICLARAIVRRNKILILDEATANVDPETDSFIQRTIARQFANCTVLTIAHRLVTIVDSDRVLVLDRGEVREFDTPYELLQNSDGIFTQMVGSSTQQALRLVELIHKAHENKHK